jgi:hypothetical protein
MQALTGEDCIEIGVLAQWAPVGLAERRAALATSFALSTLARAAATKADLFTRGVALGLGAGCAAAGGQRTGLGFKGGLGHLGTHVQPA